MEFASKNFAADGRAALALVVSLIEVLEEQGLLKPVHRQEVIDRATRIVPDSKGNLDVEARGLLIELAEAQARC